MGVFGVCWGEGYFIKKIKLFLEGFFIGVLCACMYVFRYDLLTVPEIICLIMMMMMMMMIGPNNNNNNRS